MTDNQVIAGTGHRPPKLGLGYDKQSRGRLLRFVIGVLEDLEPSLVISGMAQGFDQALAEAALQLGFPVLAAVAFPGMEAKWPADARARYDSILYRAREVHFVCPKGYAPKKFADRDRWMVDHADSVLALYDEAETKSGTGITVAYARALGKPVRNVWPEWAG